MAKFQTIGWHCRPCLKQSASTLQKKFFIARKHASRAQALSKKINKLRCFTSAADRKGKSGYCLLEIPLLNQAYSLAVQAKLGESCIFEKAESAQKPSIKWTKSEPEPLRSSPARSRKFPQERFKDMLR